MIAIIDYGVGNLFNLKSSFDFLGIETVVTNEKETVSNASHIVLPGVGAFGDAAKKLSETGLKDFLVEQAKNGKPFLGICLGMQLLFNKSFEYGVHEGLSLINGEVVPIIDDLPEDKKGLDIPQIGWNALHIENESPLLKYTDEGDCVYFVHSYYAKTDKENLIATAQYGIPITAAVQNENVFGTQFHPEKSGSVGLKMLKAFSEI
ncbi:MAG: imidazole glycerol phosphate synthase subunit HisH [Clostridiales bacterium]|nr:imidazole glycerol phosphate synthase subunit HisH [Clostridiales bacterium]